ncbi:MAG: hypothetical protein KA761_00410 [Gemmatimonadaceae bacterium]|nr:hypothetical protein [Gemmatimonadaceae bacterium]
MSAATPARWMRYRFHVEGDDCRPMTWPPLGPFWRSGESTFGVTVICWWPEGASPYDDQWWPDAMMREAPEGPFDEIAFTDRFRRPEWWTP